MKSIETHAHLLRLRGCQMQVKKLIRNELKLVKFTNQDSEMMQEGGEEAQDHMWEKKAAEKM